MNTYINGHKYYINALTFRKALSRPPRQQCTHFNHNPIRIFALLALIGLLLTACSARTNVHQNQYSPQSASNEPQVQIYFLRPTPPKFKGISDNVIDVEYKGTRLLTVNEGRYALVKLKASDGPITTHSLTMFTNQDQPIKVTRTRHYRFIAGKTYFIHLKRVNEEFRGIFYDPAPINLEQAKVLAKELSPYGEARNAPIKNITSVDEPQLASPLEPAMPEQLYPGHKYLIKGTPTYSAPQPPPQNRNEMTFDQAPSEPVTVENK